MADFRLTIPVDFGRALARMRDSVAGKGIKNLLTTLSDAMVPATGHTHDRAALGEGGELNGASLADVADDNIIGGVPVLHRIDITAGALGNTDVILTHKTRIIDAWLVLNGAGVAATTFTVRNLASDITDTMAASGSDQALVRAATIDDANHEIAAAGTLRVTSLTGATQPDATVYVLGIRVP